MNVRNEASRMEGQPATRAATTQQANGEFLTFRLGGEEYAIDILCVQEIRSYEEPTRIANALPFIKGVVGAVVDSVSDVLELADELIKSAPEMNSHVDTSFITDIARVGERMLILTDIEALMSSSDMGLMGAGQRLQ